jgi:large subunit ribosomal protein L29
MNVRELREKDAAELREELRARLREQFNLRMQKGSGQTPRPHLFKAVRRGIARIKTVMSERSPGSGK